MKRLFNRHHLVQKGVDQPLTPKQEKALQAYRQTDAGALYMAVHTELKENLPQTLPQKNMSKQELKKIAAHIEAQVQQKRRTRHLIHTFKTMATATAVVLLLAVGLNWFLTLSTTATPVTAPLSVSKPSPTPPPTLGPGMISVDLTQMPVLSLAQLSDDLYTRNISELQAAVPYDLYLPTQYHESAEFVGGMINPDTGSVEIAIRTAPPARGLYPLWILSQQPLDRNAANKALTTAYQPFAGEPITITKLLSNTTTVYDIPARLVVNELYAIEKIDDWKVINQLTWQMHGRQFTLTLYGTAILNEHTMSSMVQNYNLTLVKDPP